MRISFTLMILSIFMVSMGIFSMSVNSIYGQIASEENETSDEENESFDWTRTAEIVGLASILSGLLSAVFTHFFSIKKLSKEIHIKNIEDRQKIYGQIKSYLDRMINNPQYQNESEPTEKLNNTIDDVDKIIMPFYYLIDHKIQKKWWEVRYSLKAATSPYPQVDKFNECKKYVQEMHDLLIKELET